MLNRLRERRALQPSIISQPIRDYRPYGNLAKFWDAIDSRIVVSGPSDCGKTLCALHKIDQVAWQHPGVQIVIIRNSYADMPGSVLESFNKKVIKLQEGQDTTEDGIRMYGGVRPFLYKYPNNSSIRACGMDNPGTVLSSERDYLYVNQAEEISLGDYEYMTTRVTGRAGNTPTPQLILDCNPAYPQHWIKQTMIPKENGGDCLWIDARHQDNPTIYDPVTGELTPEGDKRLEPLRKLTGARRGRLFLGLWVAAEGMVYEGDYDPNRNLVPRKPIPMSWPRYWAIDFGYNHAFVWIAAALDPDGRIIVYREIHYTERLVQEHCRDIMRLTLHDAKPKAIITDHDAEDRATFERHSIYCETCDEAITPAQRRLHQGHRLHQFDMTTKAAFKSVSPGIQAVAADLRASGDGKPRVMIQQNILAELDQKLKDKHRPVRGADEFESYVWATSPSGKLNKEEPVKDADDFLDCLRYLCAEVRGLAKGSGSGTIAVGKPRPTYKVK